MGYNGISVKRATSQKIPREVTQMVTHENQDTRAKRRTQGPEGPIAEANKITAATPYDPVTFCYTSLSL